MCCHNCCWFICAAVLLCPKDVLLQSSTAAGSSTLCTHVSTVIPEPWREDAVVLPRTSAQASILRKEFPNESEAKLELIKKRF